MGRAKIYLFNCYAYVILIATAWLNKVSFSVEQTYLLFLVCGNGQILSTSLALLVMNLLLIIGVLCYRLSAKILLSLPCDFNVVVLVLAKRVFLCILTDLSGQTQPISTFQSARLTVYTRGQSSKY